MRINDPKKLIGINDNKSYNLITFNELQYILNPFDSIKNNGYAWLNDNGKIDQQLIPSISITNTYVFNDHEIFNGNIPDEYINNEDLNKIEIKLSLFISKYNNDNEQNLIQEGDVIIITPSENSQQNINVHGAFIIIDSDNHVKRLSYDNGYIISINNKRRSSNTPGNIEVALSDIILNNDNLKNALYNIGTIPSDNTRLSFKNENDELIPYTKLIETKNLNYALSSINLNVNNILNIISGSLQDKTLITSMAFSWDKTLSSNIENEPNLINWTYSFNKEDNQKIIGIYENNEQIYPDIIINDNKFNISVQIDSNYSLIGKEWTILLTKSIDTYYNELSSQISQAIITSYFLN